MSNMCYKKNKVELRKGVRDMGGITLDKVVQ